MSAQRGSYAEITLKSGAVITFPCISLTWRRDITGSSLKWEQTGDAARRPVYLDPDEIAAAVFVDGTR